MDWKKMALEAEGLQTVESFARGMGIRRGTAIRYLHELRANGFVDTRHGRGGKRLYEVSPLRLRPIGSKGYLDIINENSRMKVRKLVEERVYGRDMSVEEAIIRALGTKDYRIILASLPLFRKVRDWSMLYRLAKAGGNERRVGVLYGLARKLFRVKRVDGRILRRMKEAPIRGRYVIDGMKSSDFKELEREWGIHLPFNRSDLKRLGV